MTLTQFQEAFTIAKSTKSLTDVDDSNLYGFGLDDFKPVHTTIDAVAKTIRWQALQFDGNWNAELLDEVAKCGRRNFIVLG